jgi:hypothetical protein
VDGEWLAMAPPSLADGIRWHQMAGHGEKLGRKQEDAIAALFSQRNIEEAARAGGVGARTLIRWLKLPDFSSEYRKARREAVQQAVARLQQATGAAGTVALKLLTDPNVPAAVRLRAAEFVFAHAIKGIELEDIETRLTELERAAGQTKDGRRSL